jgi:cupin fold WbuC family metalloprotein
MKRIDDAMLNALTERARETPRKRAHFNLHPELNDPVQRLCIAMEPDTYVRPHRHSDPETWELLVILRGSLVLAVFDEKGTVVERTVLNAGGPITALEFPMNTWHAPVSLEPGTVVLEIKQGPYRPISEANLASWAPPEGAPDTGRFLHWYRNAKAGDAPPTANGK